MIIPLSDKYNDYAKKVCKFLNNCDIRASIDERSETVGKKIRENELKRLPYQLVVGEKEQVSETVSVRKQGGEDLGAMSLEGFEKLIKDEIKAMLS